MIKNKIIQINNGKIKGIKEGKNLKFFSIPYATCNRFSLPLSLKPWKTTLDCTKYRNDAFQHSDNNINQSEDCLNLSIWTSENKEKKKLPVFVWIHGGGFAIKGPNQEICNGEYLMRKDIVVVCINYRLNAFGFYANEQTQSQALNDKEQKLYWKDKTKKTVTTTPNNNPIYTNGNWGLCDQVKALQWIKQNIRHFNGDPSNITVGGESAGSFSVSNLLFSPVAFPINQSDKKPLFQKAIMESGCLWNCPSNEQKISICKKIDEKINKKDPTPEDYVNATVFCWDMIKKEQYDFKKYSPLGPSADEWMVVDNWKERIKNNTFNPVPLLLGWNENEGLLFSSCDSTKDMKETNDIGSYQHFINERLFQFKNKDEYSNMKKIMNKEKLTDLLYDKKANLLQCQKIITLYFSTPMVFLSQLFSSKKIPVYLYNFCYKSSYPIKAPKTSTHTSELPFVFNTIKFDSKEDSMMQKKIENNWLSFIKKGKVSDKRWKPFTLSNKKAIHFCNKQEGYVSFKPYLNFSYINMLIDNFFNK